VKRFTYGRALFLALPLLAPAAPGHATVYFQNAGTTSGWSRVYAQQRGRVYQTSSPSYKGTVLAFEQTWNNVQTGYHSEAIRANAQAEGQDRYYGKVIRFNSDWAWENDNYTFAQWSPEDPEGPWCLQFLQNQSLRIQRKAGGGIADLGAISRGTWIRVVVRFRLGTNGMQEVWVNGAKKMSVAGNISVPGTTVRWSNGIYCTGWRDTTPAAAFRKRTIYQDNFRITSTLAEAEPNSW